MPVCKRPVVETKIDLDSHADTCAVGDHCQIVNDHNRPAKIYGYDLKAGSKHVCIVNATIAYTEPETGQVVILSINKMIEIKGLNHNLLCSMQCCLNGVLIDVVPTFLVPIPSEIMHAIQIINPFDAIHPIIIPLKMNRVTSYSKVRNQLKKSMRTRISSR